MRLSEPEEHANEVDKVGVMSYDLEVETGRSLVVITGMEKPFRPKLSERDHARLRQLGEEHRSRVPRSVLG